MGRYNAEVDTWTLNYWVRKTAEKKLKTVWWQTPHDAAKSILFLSCDDSSGITGTTLVIDAGYLTAAEWDNPGKTKFMDTK